MPDYLYKTYVAGTHLNYLDLLRQSKSVTTIHAFIKKQIKYRDCNLKTMKSLDYAIIIGVCAVIRSNTVNNNINKVSIIQIPCINIDQPVILLCSNVTEQKV